MNDKIAKLAKLLGSKKNKDYGAKFENKVLLFESKNDLVLPPDLAAYFKILDSATDTLDANLYQFYTIDQFKNLKTDLAHWEGIPNYKGILDTLNENETCYVFADYMFHMFTYAIRLYKKTSDVNEIYIICGDKYKVIANSFSDFLNLYFENSIELQFT